MVAHGMSAVAVQAAAAREIARTNPDQVERILERIEVLSRESLAELRRMLGVLRNTRDDGASLAPQPTLDDVDGAVAQSVQSGVATELVVTGTPSELPAGVGLAAYRIVQEALTNVRKHAGPTASVTVSVDYQDGLVVVEVTDDGRGAVSSMGDSGGGNGLIGMGERVDAYGGHLTAGPRAGGGYSVRAVLPTSGTERPAALTRRTRIAERTVVNIRVAVVDDQALMRDGFSMILDAQDDIDVVGDAGNGRAASSCAARPGPTSC